MKRLMFNGREWEIQEKDAPKQKPDKVTKVKKEKPGKEVKVKK